MVNKYFLPWCNAEILKPLMFNYIKVIKIIFSIVKSIVLKLNSKWKKLPRGGIALVVLFAMFPLITTLQLKNGYKKQGKIFYT
jgi:hypothetical protein